MDTLIDGQFDKDLNIELSDLTYALDESCIIAMTDQQGIIQFANKKFCELSQYSREELLGQNHRILSSGYHSKEFFRNLWKTICSGEVWRGEIRNRTKDGSFYWVHTTIVPLMNEQGKPYRYFTLRVDITEQKHIEAKLHGALKDEFTSTQKKLEENQLLYQSLYKHSQDAVFTFDTNAKIISMNPATEKLLGYSFEEFKHIEIPELIVDKYWPIHLRCFNKALNGEPQNFDIAVYHQNGERIFLNLTYLPIIVDQRINGIYTIGKDITEKKKAQKLNSYLAHHDELTKLLNRRGFEEKLTKALANAKRTHQKLAVMYLDLDRFKNINDTLGHYIGDRLLEKLALRLQAQLSEEHCIGRMGGDEFMVLVSNIENEEDLVGYAKILLACLEEPFFIEENELYVTASIGISMFPDNGDNVIDLMKHADIALYKVKDQGRNNYQIYSKIMDQSSYQRFMLERDLRKALINDEFTIHYQPRFDSISRNMTSAEALIRWNHPKHGLIKPTEFIPMAEETGLIIPIGRWVKRKVCEQLVKWKKEGIPVVPISINFSPQSFLQRNFAKNIRGILDEFNIEGRLLEIEITENSLMKNEEVVIRTINELKEMGIKIYIDDFGTGYSSFSYLKDYKIDGIKIDRSFIRNISYQSENAGITAAMIQLAQLLNIDVVAEGVETEEELLFLHHQNCSQVQGFLFSMPLPIVDFERFLRETAYLSQVL